jgi:hypothetical protein
VYIQQYGAGTASLNVAVAASIVLHHFALWAGYGEREREVSGCSWLGAAATVCAGLTPAERMQLQSLRLVWCRPAATTAAECCCIYLYCLPLLCRAKSTCSMSGPPGRRPAAAYPSRQQSRRQSGCDGSRRQRMGTPMLLPFLISLTDPSLCLRTAAVMCLGSCLLASSLLPIF